MNYVVGIIIIITFWGSIQSEKIVDFSTESGGRVMKNCKFLMNDIKITYFFSFGAIWHLLADIYNTESISKHGDHSQLISFFTKEGEGVGP